MVLVAMLGPAVVQFVDQIATLVMLIEKHGVETDGEVSKLKYIPNNGIVRPSPFMIEDFAFERKGIRAMAETINRYASYSTRR